MSLRFSNSLVAVVVFSTLTVKAACAQEGIGGQAPLRLSDGSVLLNARIVLISGEKVTITHTGGMTTVSADSVPLDVLAIAHQRLSKSAADRDNLASALAQQSVVRQYGSPIELVAPVPEADVRISNRRTLRATSGEAPRAAQENGCVFASNAKGTGTGFVLRQPDGFVLVSNQHVIDGAPPHRYELPGGRSLKPKGGFLSTDRDIAVFDLEESRFAHYFEMEPNVDAVALGEDVIIFGNAKGAGLRMSTAKLLAKSALQVEISGGIVHGNSGGPIVRAKTGKVIAVSTYARVRRPVRTMSDLIEDVVLPRVQFYGVRIDTLTKTSDFDLGQFVAVSTNLDADEARMRDALAFVALVMVDICDSRDREVRHLASKASNSTRQMVGHWWSNRPLFRQEAEMLLRPIAPASSYIHTEKRERLVETRHSLERIYRELLPKK